MARREVTLAFDDIVHGTGDHYSSSWMNLHLAEYETYMLQVVVDALSSQLETTTIQIETSGDGRQWASKNTSPEINLASTPPSVTTVVYGRDMGSAMSAAMVRFRVRIAGGANPTAKVRIYVREGNDRDLIPSRIQGLQAFLRGDVGVDLDSSGNVERWRDMSPYARDGTQSTSTRRPSPNRGQFGSQQSLFFDASSVGAEKYFNMPSLAALTTAGHLFIVHRHVADPPVNNQRSGFWQLGTSGAQIAVPWTDGNVYDDAGSTTRQISGVVTGMNAANCYEVRSAASAWSNYKNGSLITSTGVNTVGFNATPTIGGGAWGVFYDGYIAELAIFDHILTTNERNLLVGYFNDRYGLGMI